MSKSEYDTLGTSRELEAAGTESQQAEVAAINQCEGSSANNSNNSEYRYENSSLKSEFNELRKLMKKNFRWTMSLQILTFTLIVAAILIRVFSKGS